METSGGKRRKEGDGTMDRRIQDESSQLWPGQEWPTASPESRGFSNEGLNEAVAFAQSWGGGSGCVIHGGYLIKEWGDPQRRADVKSTTKGAVGTTLLGLALDRGLVAWDDRARLHYPQLNAELPYDHGQNWIDEITLRQLACMSAGFDNGRPPRLLYRPGTIGRYAMTRRISSLNCSRYVSVRI